MDWPWIVLICALAFFIVLPAAISFTVIPPLIFKIITVRSKPEKWSREAPSSSNPGIIEMWQESLRFREVYKKEESDIEANTSDGLKLKGLYYDFGSDTAVIIVPGRPESCIYSLYYGYPYAANKVNVCAIDTRAHGLSEGIYSGCGYMEKEDIFAFCKVLKEKGIKKVILHGICVGSCASIFACTDPNCPEIIQGVVTDGLFIHYYETLKRRVKKNKGPIYPTVWVFRHKIKKLYGIDCSKVGPITLIDQLRIPSLMMASKEDIFSLPHYTAALYEKNGSPNKRMDWFEHGPHSHLRRVDPAHYDSSIKQFIELVQGK